MTAGDPAAADQGLATTFPQLVRGAAAAYGHDEAILLESEDGVAESLSFAELDAKSAVLARGLVARGIGKGSRVGFIYGNGPGFALMFAAIARIGAIVVPLSTFIRSGDLVRLLRQSDITGLVLQRSLLAKDYVQRICEALPELRAAASPELRLAQAPYLRWVVSTGEALPAGIRDMTWLTGAAASVSEDLLSAIEAEVHASDQLMEIYTSGSMALPKGVRHNHGPTLFRTRYLGSTSPVRRGVSVTATLPMFWVGGLMMFLLPNWHKGVTTVCTESTSTNSRVAMGSVLADEDLVEYPQGVTMWALGMTETLGPYSYGDKLREPGYPLCPPLDHIALRYEVRVADERDLPVDDGDRGEIQVRGYAVTPGLHKVERGQCFTADGYYRTGDLGVADGGRIHFVGRDGDVIKTANTNVSPAEVEMEMQQLPGVHSAYVVGIPDQQRGQLVAAAVVARDGHALDFDVIQAVLRQRLSSYKVPQAYLEIARDEVPMLPSNKVARRQIEHLITAKIGLEA